MSNQLPTAPALAECGAGGGGGGFALLQMCDDAMLTCTSGRRLWAGCGLFSRGSLLMLFLSSAPCSDVVAVEKPAGVVFWWWW